MVYLIPGNGHIGSGLPPAGAVDKNTENIITSVKQVLFNDLMKGKYKTKYKCSLFIAC